MRAVPRILLIFVGVMGASLFSAAANVPAPASAPEGENRQPALKYNFNYDRTYATELYLFAGATMFHDDISLDGIYGPTGVNEGEWGIGSASIDLENAFTLGAGVAYNFNDHLTARLELSFANSDYEAVWHNPSGAGDRRMSGEASLFSGLVGLQYNILKGPITPFVGAGLGVSYLDTDLPDGPPSYWRDWWGYGWASYPTKDEFYFTYYVSVGLRWDFHRHGTAFISATSKWLSVGGDSGQVRSSVVLIGGAWSF